MLPGKKYTPEDMLRIVRRRIWLLLVPFAVVSAGTAVWTRTLVNMYRSETLIMIVPQQVPESYVRSTVTTGIEERLTAIQQQILSRTQLEQLITRFNLYPQARAGGIMQDVVERMRREIAVSVVRGGDSFRVSYVGTDPVTVRNVTAAIGDLFINESLQDRSALAEGTNQFLESELESARIRLAEREQQLAEYRRRHSGELPSQQQANLQAMQSVQSQIQSLLQSVRQSQDRRMQIESQIGDLEAQAVQPAAVAAAASGDLAAGTTLQQLAAARANLAGLETRLTPQHPDIGRMKRLIADLEAKAEAEALQAPLSAGGGSALPPAELTRQRRIADLRTELAQIARDIEAAQPEEARLRRLADEYQRRAEMAPNRETELIELTRDYGTLQGLYSSLLEKRESAKMATNLERRQIGETFRPLDAARVPERPFSPNRQRLMQMGMAAGFGIGALLVLLLEYRDRSFRTDEEVRDVLGMPVLAVVPLMRSAREKRTAVARRLATGLVLGSIVFGCLSVVAYSMLR